MRRPDASDVARDLLQHLDRRISAFDRPGAISLALESVARGTLTVPQMHALVLSPLMALVGGRWQSGEADVWQEHYTTGVVRTIVEALAPAVHHAAAALPPNGSTVVLACPPDEQHDLGIRMLADRFLLAGWQAHFLGADVPRDEIALAVVHLRADALVLSAATHYHRLRLRTIVDGLKAELPALRIWVTGPAFAHGHAGWEGDEVLDPASLLADL